MSNTPLLDQIFNNIDMDNADQFRKTIAAIDVELSEYKKQFKRSFVYCLGCKDHVKMSFGYEDMVGQFPRPVLRCNKCHSIIKFLD